MQVLPSLVSGGVEVGTLDIARALIKSECRSFVVSAGGPLVQQLESMGARHITLPVDSKNPWVMWKNSRLLKKLIETENIDLVHARSRAPAWSCFWATTSTKTPYVTTFHGTYGHHNTLKRWYNSVMLKSDRCIAVSNFIAQHIRSVYAEYLSNERPKLQVIHRGVDLDKFNPQNLSAERTDKLCREWNIPPDHTVVMLPGRLTRWKGQSILIEALAQIKHNKLICLMVGDNKGKDHYFEELQNLTLQHNQGNRVKFVGGCSDMPAAYALADIVVSASTDPEAFGRVACEAQAMGCLVVATKHGGSLETIAPVQQEFMCEIKDSASLATSITQTLSYCNEEKQQIRLDIERQSRLHITDNFSLDKMCANTIALYRDTLSNSTGQI